MRVQALRIDTCETLPNAWIQAGIGVWYAPLGTSVPDGHTVEVLMIETTAKCDGPDCPTPQEVIALGAEWPDSYIVIRVERERQGIGKHPGRYGFCSRGCLIRWAGGS